MQPGINPATTWTTIGMALATLLAIVLKHAIGVDLGADGMGAVATLLGLVLPFLAPDPQRGVVLTEDERAAVREVLARRKTP